MFKFYNQSEKPAYIDTKCHKQILALHKYANSDWIL